MIKKSIKELIPKKYYKIILKIYLWIKFFGVKYYCPFCRGHFNRFHPAGFSFPVIKKKKIIGAGYRENVRCPRCNSSNRERLFYLYLNDKTNNFADKIKVLHVAPEKNLSAYLKTNLNVDYVSVDIDSHLAMFKMDIQNMFFPDNIFDIVICSHVLEHINNDIKAMRELYRVMKKETGWGIIQAPISNVLEESYENSSIIAPCDREFYFGQSDHVRIYGKDYINRLKSVGFRVDKTDYAKKINKKIVNKYSLDVKECIFICYK